MPDCATFLIGQGSCLGIDFLFFKVIKGVVFAIINVVHDVADSLTV